ncbi:hypothetical protein [Janthinobacterium sp. J1-1]|uniref:SDH family Clp fold serine proteinase n=1 Tax=Janthinobacterium sp. J1-1 TaxID=3065910 RepID=UPI00281253F7|nr:hypothetical protein [Janthinobacterium sp. J1-1]
MTIDLAECQAHFADNDTDVVIYSGGIAREGYDKFCRLLEKPRRKKLLMVLNTYGGDPNAGYRIARAAIHNYGADNFSILIPAYCKSAGTLICIGATRLVMADQAELGPLDVQLRKQDELFQQSSGLDILRGVTYLQDEALQSFKTYLIDINGGAGLSTKIASEIASGLVIGLYEPLFAQVDPVKLGEMNAALQIARHYGERLDSKSKSLIEHSLNKLIMGYPTHGFVIDRSEARQLFKDVTKPNPHEQWLCNSFRNHPMSKLGSSTSAIVEAFNEISQQQPEAPTENQDENVPESFASAEQGFDANSRDEQQSERPDGGSAPNDEREQHPVGSEQDHAVPDDGQQA